MRKAANDDAGPRCFVRGADLDNKVRLMLLEVATSSSGTKFWKVQCGSIIGYIKKEYIDDQLPQEITDSDVDSDELCVLFGFKL